MSRQIQSLLIKAAAIQQAIDGAERWAPGDWMRMLRLKLLGLRVRSRIDALVARATAQAPPVTVH